MVANRMSHFRRHSAPKSSAGSMAKLLRLDGRWFCLLRQRSLLRWSRESENRFGHEDDIARLKLDITSGAFADIADGDPEPLLFS